MPTISFTVSSQNLARIKAVMVGMYGPIPNTCEDVQVEGGEEGEMESVCTPDFTENQWAKEAIRRLVVKNVNRWEQKEARDAINVQADDNLLT